MQIQITVVQSATKSATDKNGKPYRVIELAYKNNSFQGKLEEVKINQFNPVFSVVAGMKAGDQFTVVKEKNAAGFWNWESATQVAPGGTVDVPVFDNTPKTAMAAPKSTYETSEERARKQIFIVKQSSISAAIALLSIGAKTPPSTQLVLDEAQKFVDFVFSEKKESVLDLPNDLEVD